MNLTTNAMMDIARNDNIPLDQDVLVAYRHVTQTWFAVVQFTKQIEPVFAPITDITTFANRKITGYKDTIHMQVQGVNGYQWDNDFEMKDITHWIGLSV